MRSLEAFGLSSDLLDALEARYGPDLLPVQERAVSEFGLLAGRSVLVFAPTSAGKTLVAELAALRAVTQGRRALLALPTRALVEEKVAALEETYGEIGLRVVAGTRDRREHDWALRRRDYDVAVVVYEKLASLLVSSPGYLDGVGVVALDELQTISDSSRGWHVEWVLRCLRRRPQPDVPQIIGLCASLEQADDLARRLDLPALVDHRRPVPLRRGVLFSGTLHYRDDAGLWARETIVHEVPADWDWLDADDRRRDEMRAAALALTQAGERVLCFVPSKAECHRLALSLAEALEEQPAEDALARLARLPQTVAGERLTELLPRGVAFHHGDLPTELRALVEDAAHAGELRALCATSTLAMGVNVPADTVLVDPRRWRTRGGEWAPTVLARPEFDAMAGRAGRLGAGGERPFGRALLVAAAPLERDALIDAYAGDPLPDATPRLDCRRLPLWLLRVTCDEGAVPAISTGALLPHAVAPDDADEALQALRSGGLLADDGSPTELGRIAAVFGLHPPTVEALAQWAQEAAEGTDPLEVLCAVCRGPGAAEVPFTPLSAREREARRYSAEYARRLMLEGDRALADSPGEEAARRAVVLQDWISNMHTAEIERTHRVLAGGIARLSQEVGRLMEALRRVLKAVRPDAAALEATVDDLARRLASGLPAAAAGIGAIAPRGMPRDSLLALAHEGLDSSEALLDAGPERIAEIIPGWLARPLWRRARVARQAQERALWWEAHQLLGALPAPPPVDKPVLEVRSRRPHEAMFRGTVVPLTKLQFDLLFALARRPSECVSWDELYEAMWNEGLAVEPGQIGYHKRLLLKRIRSTAGPEAARGLIEPVRGRGLMLNLPPDSVSAA